MNKLGVLLVNLGTPDSPSVSDVRKFLREFLMDPLVVDIPTVARWILVNLIIAPLRGPNSAREYQLLWTDKGSPLKFHSESLLKKLREAFTGELELSLAMRYQNPDISSGLKELKDKGCDELLILPLFPQYAECTTLSTKLKVSEELEKLAWSVNKKSVHSFATDEGFIDAVVACSKTLKQEKFDHTLFSYHGIPERQLKKVYGSCLNDNCCDVLSESNKNCYRAQCVATTKALAAKLGLKDGEYSICFQSRQGKQPWVQPYIDDEIVKLAKKGVKQLRVFSPAFVADCLETTQEIAHTYGELFQSLGGEELHLVPGLNASEPWVEALKNIIIQSVVADPSSTEEQTKPAG